MNYDDNDLLIGQLQKGDEKAYVYLVDQYNKRLFGYALTLTHDHTLAEDILQNVFLKAWKQRKKIGIRSSLQNYLFKSVYNEFINQYKKKRSTMILEQKYLASLEKAINIHDDQSFENIIARITLEIENLPPKCREIFILSKKEGLTNMEISEYLNVSIKTVEAQITKAFGILRKRLEEKYKSIFMLIFGALQKMAVSGKWSSKSGDFAQRGILDTIKWLINREKLNVIILPASTIVSDQILFFLFQWDREKIILQTDLSIF